MRAKQQLINVAMICTGLLLLSAFFGLYYFMTTLFQMGIMAIGLSLQLIPMLIMVGLLAWGLNDLNQYRLTNRENRGIRVLRIWILISAVTSPVYTLAMLLQFGSSEMIISPYLIILNVMQVLATILLAAAFYRLYKLQPEQSPVDLLTMQPANSGKRFLNLLVDTFGILYSLMSLASPLMLLLGTGDGIERLFGLLLMPLAAIATVLYYTLTEAMYGQSLGKALTNTQVYFGSKVKQKTSAAWQRSFCRIVPFEVISIFMQDGPWHDSWTHTQVSDFKVAKFDSTEQSGRDDVLDGGFITRN